jgi:hypothetical protein
MGDVALFLNRAYLQLIARYPDGVPAQVTAAN